MHENEESVVRTIYGKITTKAAEISDEERLITDFVRNDDKNNTINDDEALDDVLDEDLDISIY